ncbi:MAG: sortase [Acidimicrobiales bacterium]|nr:sortase [Acidimicrobiales bacterium]
MTTIIADRDDRADDPAPPTPLAEAPPAPEPRSADPSATAPATAGRRVDGRSIAATVLSIGGGVLIAYVLFQLLVTPMIASRAQRELAGELGERIDTAAALATGSASTGLGSTIGNFGDLDLEHPQIPDLVGQLPSDAEAQLVELGFTVTRAPEQSRELVPGLVTRTDPPTDARQDAGAEVTVFVSTLAPGSPVASLSIDAIGLSAIVVEGTTSTELMQGPGHYRDSVLPGEPGNAVIFGRRSTYGAPFGQLDQLEPGATINVTTLGAEFTYTVRERRVVAEGDTDVLGPSEQNLLTLVTSSPRYQATERLVVVAELDGDPLGAAIDPEAEAVGEAIVLTPDEKGLASDATAWGPFLLWFELLLIAIVVTVRLLRGAGDEAAVTLAGDQEVDRHQQSQPHEGEARLPRQRCQPAEQQPGEGERRQDGTDELTDVGTTPRARPQRRLAGRRGTSAGGGAAGRSDAGESGRTSSSALRSPPPCRSGTWRRRSSPPCSPPG